MRILLTTIFAITAIGCFCTPGAIAQQPEEEQAESTQSAELWYYREMLARYDSPKEAVRRKAEFRAQQRQARMAAMKWYGFSNSRPVAAAQPFTSPIYSPAWRGSWSRPYAWHTTGRPTVVVKPGYRVYR